jgi:carbamate kinase
VSRLPSFTPVTPARVKHRAVVALGGNALSPAGERSTIHDQFRHTREALAPVVEMALDGWHLCVVHGNGPQVGDELQRNEAARDEVEPLPLGVLVAGTAGWIGYMIQQSIENALRAERSDRSVVAIITQVAVAADDPALRQPTKFIGHELTAARAEALASAGVAMQRDGRGRLRRVVGSPRPIGVVEGEVLRRLVGAGTIVVACGGGGVPVCQDARSGRWEGVDAVIDKDFAAAVVARDLGAELLLILTDVDAVYRDWGTAHQKALPRLSLAEAESFDRAGAFGDGSMAPKVRAAIDFVRHTGGRAIITELSRGLAAVRGEAGTIITAEYE